MANLALADLVFLATAAAIVCLHKASAIQADITRSVILLKRHTHSAILKAMLCKFLETLDGVFDYVVLIRNHSLFSGHNVFITVVYAWPCGSLGVVFRILGNTYKYSV